MRAVIDTTDLLEACGTGEDYNAELLREILGHVISQNGDRLAHARAALAAGQLVELAQLAHGIKGSAALVGAQQLTDLARRIERDAANLPAEVLEQAIGAMETEFQAVVRALHERHPDAVDAPS
jgi:HPt (histidine-containing phosphotransfer) domain-containing protein